MVHKNNEVSIRIHYVMDSLNKYWVYITQGIMENMGKNILFPLWSCRHTVQHTKLVIFIKVPQKCFRLLILLCPRYKCSALKSVELATFRKPFFRF